MIRLEGKIVDADAKYLTICVPYTPEYATRTCATRWSSWRTAGNTASISTARSGR